MTNSKSQLYFYLTQLTHLQNLNDQLLYTHPAWRRYAATISQSDVLNARSFSTPNKNQE